MTGCLCTDIYGGIGWWTVVVKDVNELLMWLSGKGQCEGLV